MNINWTKFPTPLYSGDEVTCDIDGTPVSATVLISAKDVTVQMTSPMAGVRNGRHVPYAAAYLLSAPDGCVNERALSLVKFSLIPELWQGYQKTLTLVPEVVRKIDRYNRHFDALSLERKKLQAEKRILELSFNIDDPAKLRERIHLREIRDKIDHIETELLLLPEKTFGLRKKIDYCIENPLFIVEQVSGKKIKTRF